ncbi:MAG: acyl-ACP--UDP-N-acetylglucosamine O-acyltransferase [Planctomycetota bacterium]|nr:acyl-ACP--UDP-N-acetylglucosamine O-acyltransferase [Planctomycetota bacterium]
MTTIHPTAVVDARAELADDVVVGAYAVIEGTVRIGAGSEVMANACVMGDTTLGEGNRIFPGAVIGAVPQDLKYEGEPVRLEVGDHNIFREHVTVHPGTGKAGGLTRIGNRNLLMVGCHVAHDCVVGDGVILSNHVLLAGHVYVQDGAIMNGASACHHFTTIGRLAYVGGLTRITVDVPPFSIVEGHPARVRAANVIGMRRSGMDEDDVQAVKRTLHRILISQRVSSSEAIEEAERNSDGNRYIGELLEALRASQAGRQGRALERPRG